MWLGESRGALRSLKLCPGLFQHSFMKCWFTWPSLSLLALLAVLPLKRAYKIQQHHFRIVLALAAILLLACGPLLAQTPISGIGYGSVGAARQALTKRLALRTAEQAGWTIMTDEQANAFTTWTFAPRAHTAYPSLVRRDIIFKNGNPTLVTRVLCEARRGACDTLYARLQAQIARCTSNCTTVLP